VNPALREVAAYFLRLGFTAFGGPAAHIAMMEEEVVRRRRWMTRERFLDLLAFANLIPGPSSTELAIFIGYEQAGVPGLLAAGLCFILPAFAMVLAIAWAYVRYGHLPPAAALLYGVKPVIIAIVLQAVFTLGRSALKSRLLWAIGAAATAASLLGANALLLLVAAGIVALAPRALARLHLSVPLPALFLFFLKVGAVLHGSGYVLLAFLHDDLIERTRWLTEAQLLDAVAVGQVTPGPVFTTATFIGYLLAGVPGAAVSTVGIFLPAFLFVAFTRPLIARLRSSPVAGAFLDGVVVASLALMAAVTWQLWREAVVDATTALIAVASAVALFAFRLNSAWLVLGGGLIGLLAQLWRR
jgi:chromate transporter